MKTMTAILLAAATLRALSGLRDAAADTASNVLDVAAIGLVRGLGRAGRTLAQRGGRRVALAEVHEALHALTTAAIQLLAIVVGRKAAYALAVAVLIVHIAIRARGMLLAVQTLPVRRLRLHGAWGLLRSRRRSRLRARRTLEDSRVLDELLSIAGVVGRAVVLTLRVWGVVERKRGWVSLLRTLADRLCLVPALRGLW